MVEDSELQLFPEFDQDYWVPGQKGRVVSRTHGKVWKVLRKKLEALGADLANNRVGLFGPDLFGTHKGKKILFEIKSRATPSNLYEAFGQLHIYDWILGGGNKKIVVLPAMPKGKIAAALKKHRIAVLTFKRREQKIFLGASQIESVLKGQRKRALR
jgi:hypothetical protein